MGKYLVLWEVDQTKIPIDRKERGTGWGAMINMVKQDIEKGLTKDWGAFFGENNGYAILEGPELDIMKQTQQYVPYVSYQVHPVASVSQVAEVIGDLSQ